MCWVVVGEHEPLRARLRRHMHGERRGRMTPIGFRRELVLGVLAVVEQQVHIVAKLEDGVGDGAAVEWRLMVGQVRDGPALGFDAVAQGDAAVRDRTGHHLGRPDGEVLVPGVDHDHLAPELIHVDREYRRLHRRVEGVLEGPLRLSRTMDREPGPGVLQGAEERQTENVVEVEVGQEGGRLQGRARCCACPQGARRRALEARCRGRRSRARPLRSRSGGTRCSPHIAGSDPPSTDRTPGRRRTSRSRRRRYPCFGRCMSARRRTPGESDCSVQAELRRATRRPLGETLGHEGIGDPLGPGTIVRPTAGCWQHLPATPPWRRAWTRRPRPCSVRAGELRLGPHRGAGPPRVGIGQALDASSGTGDGGDTRRTPAGSRCRPWRRGRTWLG